MGCCNSKPKVDDSWECTCGWINNDDPASCKNCNSKKQTQVAMTETVPDQLQSQDEDKKTSRTVSESDIIARVEAADNKITRKFDDGKLYVCQMKGGKPNGYGTCTYFDGETYVGEWKNGKRNGNGTNTFVSGNKYVGEWKNGNKDGNGTYTFANGNKYIGEWKDDNKNGNGTKTWTSGEKYVGEYKDGYRHGQGTETLANGTIYYSGEWVNDKPKKDEETKNVS